MNMRRNTKADRIKKTDPIGIFDSGLGGLTVLREVQRLLPAEDIVYLGDSARLPYGTKSKRQITDFSFANVRYLIEKKVKAIIIACNSSSANAYYTLKKNCAIPIVDVIRPVAREAALCTKNKKIGVIGTGATIASGAYQREIAKRDKSISVFNQACPLFVPLVEEGWLTDPITRSVIKKYLIPLARKKIDTLILGCTHYPLLKNAIKRELETTIEIIDSGPSAARALRHELVRHDLLNTKPDKGTLQIFVTDLSPRFTEIGERFLKQPLGHVCVVSV
jgi:glutamate racemase